MSDHEAKRAGPIYWMIIGMFIAPPLLSVLLVWVGAGWLAVAAPLMLGVLATRLVFEPGSNWRGLFVILYVVPASAVLVAILFAGTCAFRGECL